MSNVDIELTFIEEEGNKNIFTFLLFEKKKPQTGQSIIKVVAD